ncbi:CaiB/BaiF CoA transferase family protein [Nannocystis bainbridge]|uniref:CoA transferase n=1 Tax=Nannocystis bainbridge TaxID=2995303 RepID=A0ABT5E7W4_9BACT|nr:CoA transferase [Nannocystis bainbridge]MDC0721949.1 CoA transferase [Nannocystis bainbridge]
MEKAALPLAGLRVLDLSRILAGPSAAQLLGDLGADVIKIEHPLGDDTRRWGPPDFEGSAAYYLACNRNKRSRVLDFKRAIDRQELLGLLAGADVLLENFKVGDLGRHGLDYATLAPRFPRLVYCSITGFGQTGPDAGRVGYDALIQGLGGLMSITGPDHDHPTKVGVAVADLGTGLYAVVAILAALLERSRSGLGQHIDLALLDAQVAGLANIATNFLCTGEVPRPLGNAHPTIVPYQSFATADRPLMLAIGSDPQFASLCVALDEPAWAIDPRFVTNSARVAHRAELVARLEHRLSQKTRDEWLRRFATATPQFPHGPIRDLAEVAADPQVTHRDLFKTMDDGRTPCLKNPIVFSRTPIQTYRRPPHLDEHPDATWLEEPV